MKKKTLSLILALLMVVSLLPVSAFAASTVQSGTCGDNLTWTLDDAGVLTITGTGEMTSYPWSDYKDSVKSLVINDGIDRIPAGAFSGCTNLTEISIPSSVKTIFNGAFSLCGLTSLVIPSSVEIVGPGAFCECTALKNVNIEAALESIEIEMFRGCSSLESISFSNSVKLIESGAFSGCDALKEVYFDGTVAQCALIDVRDGNDVLENVIVYCSQDYPFSDIADSGYRDYISIGKELGIVNGYPDGTYRPNNPVTRAQYITMLHNMCGNPQVITPGLLYHDAGTIPDAYLNAVKWGVVTGIIKGYGDNTFRPNKEISRAEMAAFSYRFIKYIVDGEPTDELKVDCNFRDSASIANDFREAVNVCANLGIIQGFPDGSFRPNATANRGQAATILVRVAASLGS